MSEIAWKRRGGGRFENSRAGWRRGMMILWQTRVLPIDIFRGWSYWGRSQTTRLIIGIVVSGLERPSPSNLKTLPFTEHRKKTPILTVLWMRAVIHLLSWLSFIFLLLINRRKCTFFLNLMTYQVSDNIENNVKKTYTKSDYTIIQDGMGI